MVGKALVVDEDFLMRGHVVESLQKEGISVMEAGSREEARRLLNYRRFDLVFSDLDIYDACGLREFGRGQKRDASAIHIVMTSFSTVERAIKAVRNGAYDYLMKPFSLEQVSIIVLRVRELLKLRAKIGVLEEQVGQAGVEGDDLKMAEPATPSPTHPTTANLQDLERQTIIRVLHETGGSRAVMAEKLGISVRTLRNKLTQYKQEALFDLCRN